MVYILIYYNIFVKTLKVTRFKLNTYDPCVANFVVKNKQQTICFHVDNCNILHQESKVNDKFINKLCHEYESVFEDGSGKM